MSSSVERDFFDILFDSGYGYGGGGGASAATEFPSSTPTPTTTTDDDDLLLLYDPLTEGQEIVLSALQVGSAILSLTGSLLIVFKILRSSSSSSSLRRKHRSSTSTTTSTTPYDRIMLGLSTCDIVASVAYASSPFLLPSETSQRVWASGNERTCDALGFLTQLAALWAVWYNCLLSVYYLLTVRFQVRRSVFTRRYEPWMHLSGAVFFPMTATLGYRMGWYGEQELIVACWVKHVPGIESATEIVGYVFGGVPMLTTLLALVINNVVICQHVRKTLVVVHHAGRRRRRLRHRHRNGGSSNDDGDDGDAPKTSSSTADSDEENDDDDSDCDCGCDCDDISGGNDSGSDTDSDDNKDDDIESSGGNGNGEKDSNNSSGSNDGSPGPRSVQTMTTTTTTTTRRTTQLRRLSSSLSALSTASGNDPMASVREKLAGETAVQGILYVSTFLLTCVPVFVLVVLDGSFGYGMSDKARIYPLLVLNSLMVPLQGFFNVFIYVRPSYNRFAAVYPDRPVGFVLKKALFESKIPRWSMAAAAATARSPDGNGGVDVVGIPRRSCSSCSEVEAFAIAIDRKHSRMKSRCGSNFEPSLNDIVEVAEEEEDEDDEAEEEERRHHRLRIRVDDIDDCYIEDSSDLESSCYTSSSSSSSLEP